MEPGGEGGREAQNTGIMEIKSHPCAADPRHIELSGRLIHARDLRRGPCCPELKRVLVMSNLILLVMSNLILLVMSNLQLASTDRCALNLETRQHVCRTVLLHTNRTQEYEHTRRSKSLHMQCDSHTLHGSQAHFRKCAACKNWPCVCLAWRIKISGVLHIQG